MNCRTCAAPLATDDGCCPACGAAVTPPTKSSPEPAPEADAPAQASARAGASSDLSAARQREKEWQDEVRERVRDRRRFRGQQARLPLLDDEQPLPPAARPLPLRGGSAPQSDPVAARPAEEHGLADLPLQPPLADPYEQYAVQDPGDARIETDADDAEIPAALDWPLGPTVPAVAPRPVERPATPSERILAAIVDLGALSMLGSAAIYFAGKAAQTPVVQLLPAWPYLCGYLALLGLTYAAYFTGTTGQTLGKIACGLRVVDRSGHPPGHWRALLRAALSLVSLGLAGLGFLPIVFDPARRALHDRLVHARVIKD